MAASEAERAMRAMRRYEPDAVVPHARDECAETSCDRPSTHMCAFSARRLCEQHRAACDSPGCTGTAVYRCVSCGRRLCREHRSYAPPIRYPRGVVGGEPLLGKGGAMVYDVEIHGLNICQACTARNVHSR